MYVYAKDVKSPETPVLFVPSIRSGGFADIGPRRYIEDEHIRIDDQSAHLGSLITVPEPSGASGFFALSFLMMLKSRQHLILVPFCRFFMAMEGLRLQPMEAFLLADMALAEDSSVSSSSGTTALTALVVGRLLMVANAGDCRAVLCRKGDAIDMSQDHRPSTLKIHKV
ncbi:hypothetical protein SASPL_101609 [Salvia splendens]|uniref:PPM-type phosphatase domain-containing protein n=1 Tax=Salvia splendens TaxID=180675 RepID=A0A8X9AC25_SALSN|nr:hypothetical protein SASPL_101609 [Salvia splendens]